MAECKLKRKQYVLEELAENIFSQAESYFEKHGKISDELLLELHSIHGVVFERATDFLDGNKVIEYRSRDHNRKLYTMGNTRQQFVLFNRINFCPCHAFKCQVLHTRDLLTCKHVLALRLAQISKRFKSEVVSESQFIELLNNQVDCIVGD